VTAVTKKKVPRAEGKKGKGRKISRSRREEGKRPCLNPICSPNFPQTSKLWVGESNVLPKRKGEGMPRRGHFMNTGTSFLKERSGKKGRREEKMGPKTFQGWPSSTLRS